MGRWKIGLLLGWLLVPLFLCGVDENALAASAGANLSEERRYVALTFDDGPLRSTTTRLLDGLRERGVTATFFLVGERIAGNEDLVRRMQAEGHQVGNHSWSHKKLQGAGETVILQEFRQTDQTLQGLLGEGSYWLRPPYGLLRESEKALIPVPMVHWSVDPEDWKTLNQKTVVREVMTAVQPGDVILLHDIYDTSVDAALEIVDRLTTQGYWFATVEELLALYGIEPQPGEMYRSARA